VDVSYPLRSRTVPVLQTQQVSTNSRSQCHPTTDGQSASVPCSRATIWNPQPVFLFSSKEIIFSHVRVSYYEAPSLTGDGSVIYSCNCFWTFARAVTLGPKSRRTRYHNSLSYMRLPQPGGTDPPIFIPRKKIAQFKPRTFGSTNFIDLC
jgi:hypothetical protein